MTDTPNTPAWRPDPTGRFAQRWHDGSKWTDHVADAQGTTSSDPYPADARTAAPVGGQPAPGQPTPSWTDPTTVGQQGGAQADPTAMYGGQQQAPPPQQAWSAPPAQQPPPQQAWGTPPAQQAPGYGAPVAPGTPGGYAPPAYGAPAGAPAKRGGVSFNIVGIGVVVVGAILAIVGLFALNWATAKGGQHAKFGDLHKSIKGASDVTFMTKSFINWGAYVALVVGLVAAGVGTFLKKFAVVGFVLALLAAVWAAFAGFDFVHWLDKDKIAASPSVAIGVYLAVIGFVIAAVGSILPSPHKQD